MKKKIPKCHEAKAPIDRRGQPKETERQSENSKRKQKKIQRNFTMQNDVFVDVSKKQTRRGEME